MIDLSVSINPYTAKNECGDFYAYLELEDYYLLAVGDIGGHGSNAVYETAMTIKAYIAENKNDNTIDLIKKIHEHPSLKHTGMTLFLAQVYKNLPLINYSAVGNTKSILFRNKNIMTLNSQDGILGYAIPGAIKTNMIKVLKDDLLIVTTDGVSFNNNQEIVSKLKQTKDLESITKFFTTHVKNDDDSLCAVLRFNNSKTNDFSIKYVNDTPSYPKPLIDNTIKQEVKSIQDVKTNYTINQKGKHSKINTNTIVQHHKNKKLYNLDAKYLLSENIKKESIDLAIKKIKLHSALDKNREIKIKTFLHEVTDKSQVNIYIRDNIVQLLIKDIDKFKSSVAFLFKDYYIFEDNQCIITIFLDAYIKLSCEEFNDLKRIVKLNLSDKDFEIYKEREKFLSDMAYKDNLTQIYNRNKFNQVAKAELIRVKRYNRIFSIAIIDIDHFKSVNDTYGHLVGDEVLMLLADCLKENVRASDTYARWGGEEFVLLFPETNSNGGFTASEKLRQKIETLSHQTAGSITASFGVTQYKDGDTLESLLKRCDDALYEAKEGGRNMVCVK